MIELRGLHLGNIARSPSESVRPDLWPDHAWVPALGPQALPPAHGAHGLFDLAGSWPAVGVRSAAYPVSTGIYPTPKLVNGIWCMSSNAVSNNNGAGLAANGPTGTSSPFSWSSAMTLITVIFPQNAIDDRILLEDGTAYNTNCFFLLRRDDTRMLALVSGPGGYAEVRTSEYIPAGEWVVLTIRWGVQTAAAGKPELFHGIDCVRAVSTSAVTSPLNAGNAPLTFFGRPAISGEILSLAPPADTALSCILAYGNRALLDSQISDLHADPLLPFRRRQPVFYSVPSGGGASLAAASAWRVFTAAAINTAWAIRAALDGATGWAVLTQSAAATGWRIAAASDASIAWALRADASAGTSWRIATAEQSATSWRILDATEADTAWRIAGALQASSAWAICTKIDAATAWAILASGALSASTGWRIETATDTETGWRIKDGVDHATAWAIRNGMDAATAWDIQTALANATAWQVRTDLQADTAWTVITDMDADAAWAILAGADAATGWAIYDSLDTLTAWRVESDIIPEPVRMFVAPGRQLIINAPARVLIVTKPRI